VWIGHEGPGFAYDNETPRHRTWLRAFRLSNRLATNAEYLAFMADGGYQRPEWWLSDGWAVRRPDTACHPPARQLLPTPTDRAGRPALAPDIGYPAPALPGKCCHQERKHIRAAAQTLSLP
jgi:formylglycine-generating enzyme required for sulfatase activity